MQFILLFLFFSGLVVAVWGMAQFRKAELGAKKSEEEGAEKEHPGTQQSMAHRPSGLARAGVHGQGGSVQREQTNLVTSGQG
jgi:Na+-transporting methylmalonyl-CoA/oxaloacetate decarboxylase gamma subunit